MAGGCAADDASAPLPPRARRASRRVSLRPANLRPRPESDSGQNGPSRTFCQESELVREFFRLRLRSGVAGYVSSINNYFDRTIIHFPRTLK